MARRPQGQAAQETPKAASGGLRPRLRTPPRPPRSRRLLGHDHPHDPSPRPPEEGL